MFLLIPDSKRVNNNGRFESEQKKDKNLFLPSGAENSKFEFSWEVRVTRSNQNKLFKKMGLYLISISMLWLTLKVFSLF